MGDFPQATREAWLARVGDFEKLVSLAPDGFRIEALYQQQAGPRAERCQPGPWKILQRVDHPQAGRANIQALEDLENGAQGLAFARSFDAAILANVALHAISFHLEGGDSLADAFAAYVAGQPIDPARLDVSFGARDAGLIGRLKAQGFAGPFARADGRNFHNAGATEAQELASVLWQLVSGLRKDILTSATLAANQDMFLTLAKFRSLRLLWNRVLEGAGMAERPLQVHAETSRRMMAVRDPHANLLRSTAAVFGAGLGGCDSITVLPFSTAQGLPNAFARRMARNAQLILQEEAQLWRVADAASGAGYVESLTHDLCVTAWKIFQNIEKTGNLPAFDRNNPSSAAIIGATSHVLEQEVQAAVESEP